MNVIEVTSSSDYAPEREAICAASLRLDLIITEQDLISELSSYPEGRERNEFAKNALRIGILALKQAQGRLDADVIRNEGDRLISGLESKLTAYQQSTTVNLANALKEYFDPEGGKFNERVKRLVEKDGEIERLLRSQVGPVDSELVKTLSSHLGENSQLMKILSPDESKGILNALGQTVETVLSTQRERILSEFSLDNKNGALSRLVSELTQNQGKISDGLQERIKVVVGEFSLDNESSALSRLVRRVESAQNQITSQFSLDAETSALARMRKELLDVLESHRETNNKFQQEIVSTLEAIKARKSEAGRSTTHGHDFEEAVFQYINSECQKTGDIAEDTGNTVGLIKNCKVGDCVITLGPDHAGAGAAIAIEVKESASYDIKKSLEEIETARKNRGAEVGLFIHSGKTAPEGLSPLCRYGNDVVVVWNAEDEATDVFLRAGLMVAKALCTRAMKQKEAQKIDFETTDRAIREIEKQAGTIAEVTTWVGTIKNNSDKILDRVRIIQDSVQRQIKILDEQTNILKSSMGAELVEN
jgi:hypothetical protein